MIIEGDYINVLIDDGYRLAATRAQCRELIDEAVAELASRIYAGASAYDVAMCYHDSIIAAIDYAYGSDNLPEKELWAHNIIGVLGKKGAVCEGYARTFQLLLNYSDVDGVLYTKNLYTLIKFPSASKATMFVVPDETYYIAASAFEDCENLSAFTLGANVRYIGVVNWGFAYPTSDKSFKNFLSGNTGKLIDSLAGEKKFTVDPANEYYYADGDAVYSADKTKLYYVYDTVTEFVIPSELKEMERYSNDNVFENCNRLERFSVEEGNPYFAVYDGILYNLNFTAIAIVPKALKGNVTLHEGVTVIGRKVFADRIYLTGIALPESLQTINQYAFKGCTSLQNLAIPANVTIILQQAFAGCTSLRSVFLNEGLEILDSEIFINCGKLEEIVIPSTVTTIYKNVFKGCNALEKVIFNEASGWIAVKSYLAHDKITFSPQELTDPITAKDLITGDYADYVWTRENI